MCNCNIDKQRLAHCVSVLRHFINNSFGLTSDNVISGFHLAESLLSSSAHNTYVETVSDKADTLHKKIKDSLIEMTLYSYLETIKRISNKFDWKNKEFMLAFDYTDEDFYGDVQGLDIHGWTKKDAVTGKFKFLTCSVVSDDIQQKIPLISAPIRVGHYKSQVILYMLSLIKPFIGKINLLLFDRGFYDKDLMFELVKSDLPFLIFVPKHKDKKEILYPLKKGEEVIIYWSYEYKKSKTKFEFDAFMIFLKQIFDKKNNTEYDWVFATNIEWLDLSKIIKTYKKRWRIETSFRVQDEARIKCKSKEMKIRYFFFVFQQFLQTQWGCFFKEEVSFKRFIIELHKTCEKEVKNPKRKYVKRPRTIEQ